MTIAHEDIRIGTLVKVGPRLPEQLTQIVAHGFESFQLVFGGQIGECDLHTLADRVRLVLQPTTATVSSLGIYGNPLIDAQVASDWSRLIDAAGGFGCSLVCGFTGRLTDLPVPDSIPCFREVFSRLAAQAEDRGVRLAFENCEMRGNWERGDWNIAHSPAAWELMFDAVPSASIGLEWEPCHQLVSLVDPLPQLRQWLPKIFHLHGKDANIFWDVIRTHGIRGGRQYIHHRTPGFGDTNWTDVISTLRMGGWRGAIDIEGWHDPVYRDEREMTGQVHALNYLKQCRGGPFVPNPS